MNIREKNFISRLQQNNCFNKNELSIILKSFLTLTLKAPTLQDGHTQIICRQIANKLSEFL